MKSGKRKLYWDSTCWLAWLNGEGLETWPAAVVDGIQDVIHEVEAGEIILFTSTITRNEVPLERLADEQKDKFNRLLRRSNVYQIDPTPKIVDRGKEIRAYHLAQKPSRTVHDADGIHLATAIIYGADEFQTMDGLQQGGSKNRKLLALSGAVGGHNLKVVAPYKRDRPPDELVVIKGPLFGDQHEDEQDEQQTAKFSAADGGGSAKGATPDEARASEVAKGAKADEEEKAPKEGGLSRN